MKKASKLLLTSVLTIALCISLIAGATFALFTDNDSVNITVSSGKVDVSASIGDIVTHSYVEQTDGSYKQEEMKDEMAGKFAMGGEAYETDTGIVIDNILPGDKVTFNIVITNASTVTVKYQTSVSIGKITVDGKKVDGHMGLFQALDITLGDDLLVASGLTSAKLSNWTTLPVGTTEVPVTVELPYSYDDNSSDADSIQGQKCALDFTVTAVQGNAQTYDPAVANPDFDGENINTVGDIMAFRDMVNGGDTYSGQTVTLKADLDLGGIDAWEPIGTTEHPFMGTFDGQGHTVMGLNATSLAQLSTAKTSLGDTYSYGLFGSVGNSTIQNLKIMGNISITSGSLDGKQLCLTGMCVDANGKVVFDNVWSDVNIRVENVEGVMFAAGLLATLGSNGSATFQDCLNTGDIILPNTVLSLDNLDPEHLTIGMAGGLASTTMTWGSSLTNCVNVGKVQGTIYLGENYFGGLAQGATNIADKISNCYSVGSDCFGQIGSGDYSGATSLEKGSLSADDFAGLGDKWEFSSELGHPVLKLK